MENKKFIFMFVLVVFLIGAFANVQATPQIIGVNGDFVEGNSVTISGLGFGIHDDYGGDDDFLNYIWENCERGKIEKTSKWSGNGGGGWAKIDTTENRPGSRYNLFNERRNKSITYVNAFGDISMVSYRYGIKTNVAEATPVHRYFFSMWVLFSQNWGLIQNTNDGTGAKFLMSTPYDETGGKDYFSTGASSQYGEPHVATNTENGCLQVIEGPLKKFIPYSTWHRVDMFVSIPDNTTGYHDEVTWWIDGKHIRTTQQHGCYIQPDVSDVHKVGLISFVGYMYNGQDLPIYIRSDDLFLDFTQARIELCNDSEWNESRARHCEIQIPKSWNNTQITFTVNQGSFPNGSLVYLFVIDENGTASEGYPVTIGSSTDYPNCSEGRINETCYCNGELHDSGYCCTGIWDENACRLSYVDFEQRLYDPNNFVYFSYTDTVTYVPGYIGYAARSSHAPADNYNPDTNPNGYGLIITTTGGNGNDYWPSSNELYISYWLKYEEGYNNTSNNVKWLWTYGNEENDYHNELIFAGQTNTTIYGRWFLMGNNMQAWSNGHAARYWTANYTMGNWMHVEIYYKLSTGANYTNPDGIQWLKIDGNTVVFDNHVITGKPNRMSVPSINAQSPGYPVIEAGHGWWQIDEYEIWDGIPSSSNPSQDTTPPTLSNSQPSGTLPSGTTSVNISLNTNEPATCKYSTTPSTNYNSMPNTFSTTGGTIHRQLITGLQDNNTYTFYIKCQDTSGNYNTDDFLINFSVGFQEQNTCSSLSGTCLINPCTNYTNCTSLSQGTCTSGYCCFGLCNTQSPPTCTSGADTSHNGKIETSELISYINQWLQGNATINQVVNVIKEWKSGC